MSSPKPTEINFHKVSRILELSFNDGAHFQLPAEYLRVYSPSAEVQGHGPGQEVLQIGKEDVNINHLEPVGHYAITLMFDDNHDTGIYSWDYLYQLGAHYDKKWESYLDRLKAAGYTRKENKLES
jgi:DUF971 family protein